MGMEFDQPTAEHAWLHKLVGEWTMTSQMGDATCKGRETVRSLGGLWVQCDGVGEMPGGGEGRMVMTLGYDLARKQYVGTWIGSMMSRLWVYDITRESDGNTLTMASEGPAMQGEGTARYRDVITWKDDDTREFSSWVQEENGEWTRFMLATYTRVA